VNIRLLGGVAAFDSAGRQLDIGPTKCQQLLAALALDAGSSVSISRLVELLWDTAPPRTAEKTLQTYVLRLRKALGQEAIVRSGTAYRLDVPAHVVDVQRFASHLSSGDVPAALDEWTGEPMAGLKGGGFAPIVDGLVEQWLGVLESHLGSLVQKNPAEAIPQLTELTANHPFREGLWALLMTALYNAGRQADALEAFQRARNTLVEELGVEPSRRLSELEARILDQADELDAISELTSDSQAPTRTVAMAIVHLAPDTRPRGDRGADRDAVSRLIDAATELAPEHWGHVFGVDDQTVRVAFHSANDAASWSLSLLDALQLESEPHPRRSGVGIDIGDVTLRSGGYLGEPPRFAEQLARIANDGQVLLSTRAAGLVNDFDVVDLGSHVIGDHEPAHQVSQLGTASFPSLIGRRAHRAGLPIASSELIGRADDLAFVERKLATSSIVSLVGPGGIGKTRLAIEAGSRFHVGGSPVWFIDLASVSDNEDVDRAALDALGISAITGIAPVEAVSRWLAKKPGLLILDNCEHVVRGAASFAATLSAQCTGLRLLTTTREALGIPGEQLIALQPLSIEDAGVALFAERATALEHRFDITQHQEAVERICRRLDGVPLAIELAAARIRSHTPEDLLTRLDDQLRLLTAGRRGTVERHRTIRAAIEWSHDLLSDEDKKLLRRLSIFSGSFDLRAAEHVASGDDLDATDVGLLLGDLVDQSMIIADSGSFNRSYRLLETVRQYANEQLAAAGEISHLAACHADHVQAEIERAHQLLLSKREIEGASLLESLWPNLRAAMDWAIATRDTARIRSMLGPIAWQSFLRRGYSEITHWSEEMLRLSDPDDLDTIDDGLVWAALGHTTTNSQSVWFDLATRYGEPHSAQGRFITSFVAADHRSVIRLAPAAIQEARETNAPDLAALYQVFQVGSLLAVGDLDEAERSATQPIEVFRRDGPPTLLNWVLFLLGSIASIRSDHPQAADLFSEAANITLPTRTNSPNEALHAATLFRAGDHQDAFILLRNYAAELLELDQLSSFGLLALEFIKMMIAINRLEPAAVSLGHLDAAGLTEGNSAGLGAFIGEETRRIDQDRESRNVRERHRELPFDGRNALEHIRTTLEALTDNEQSARLADDSG